MISQTDQAAREAVSNAVRRTKARSRALQAADDLERLWAAPTMAKAQTMIAAQLEFRRAVRAWRRAGRP